MKRFAGFLCLTLLDVARAQVADPNWIEKPRDQVDVALLSPRGARLLDDPRFSWQHAHTPHFVIHFERKMFAQQVARQAEFFFEFIGEDMKSAKDQFTNRSHIFIFRDEKDWKHFVTTYGIQTEWAFSLVEGMVMYLQQADDRRTSAQVLGHEMTHLVLNRYYTGRIPVWLNEGTAEWYGEFAYLAFKNTRKSKRQVFRRLNNVYPVEALIRMTAYPENPAAIQSFYETAKFLVGFLQIEYPQEKFEPFMTSVMKGTPVERALEDHYGITSLEDFSKAFRKFSR